MWRGWEVLCHKEFDIQARKSDVVARHGVNSKKGMNPIGIALTLQRMLTACAYVKAVNCREVVNCTACAYAVCMQGQCGGIGLEIGMDVCPCRKQQTMRNDLPNAGTFSDVAEKRHIKSISLHVGYFAVAHTKHHRCHMQHIKSSSIAWPLGWRSISRS